MEKFLVYLLYKVGTNWRLIFTGIALVLVILLLSGSTTWVDAFYFKVVDNAADRGAITVANDTFDCPLTKDCSLTKVVYLKQGWEPSDSLWYYNTTQGSDLLPYDFFFVLEQEKSKELFRAPENMNRFRYLPQKKTRSNPDALPVGMVADTYRRRKYMGFTCAACPASQVNYKGTGIRIDGGPSAADMDTFMHELQSALEAAFADPPKHKRFVDNVLKLPHYRNAEDLWLRHYSNAEEVV